MARRFESSTKGNPASFGVPKGSFPRIFQVVRASLFANSSLISSDILPGLRGCPSNTSWALL
jgi:hypothetical protein